METFSMFVFNLHNHINEMLGKQNVLTFDEVRERYENFRARCLEKKENNKKAIDFVLKNPSWKLSIQSHKYIGVQ